MSTVSDPPDRLNSDADAARTLRSERPHRMQMVVWFLQAVAAATAAGATLYGLITALP